MAEKAAVPRGGTSRRGGSTSARRAGADRRRRCLARVRLRAADRGGGGHAQLSGHERGGELEALVFDRVCVDTMSGMTHPNSVEVRWQDRVLRGCGGDPAQLLQGEPRRWWSSTAAADPARVTFGFAGRRQARRPGCIATATSAAMQLSGEGLRCRRWGDEDGLRAACDGGRAAFHGSRCEGERLCDRGPTAGWSCVPGRGGDARARPPGPGGAAAFANGAIRHLASPRRALRQGCRIRGCGGGGVGVSD